MVLYTTPKTRISPSTATPLNIVNHGLRILMPRHLVPLCTVARMQISISSSPIERPVPATVAFNHAICWFPGIKMQPTPFAKVCRIGQTLQLPSSTATPKGWKIGLHQDTDGADCFAAFMAWWRPRNWRMKMEIRRRNDMRAI